MANTKEHKEGAYASLTGFRRAVPIILIAVAMFVAICFFAQNGTGTFGKAISGFLLGSFSIGGYFIPALLVVHALLYPSDVQKKRTIPRIIFSVLLLIFISAMTHAFYNIGEEPWFDVKRFFTEGATSVGGGVIGGIVAYGITKVIGNVGLIILALTVIAVSVTYFFSGDENPVKKFFVSVLYAIISLFAFFEERLDEGTRKKKAAKDIKNNERRLLQEKARTKREMKAAVAKNERESDLFDDDYFSTDTSLSKIRIDKLGVEEVKDAQAVEEHPNLQDKVHHPSGIDNQGSCGSEQNEPPKRKPTITFDKIYTSEDAGYKVEGGNYVYEPVTEENVSAPKRETAEDYGLDEDAASVFGTGFNGFDIETNERLAAKRSSMADVPREEAPREKKDVHTFTQEEIDAARRMASYDAIRDSVIKKIEEEKATANEPAVNVDTPYGISFTELDDGDDGNDSDANAPIYSTPSYVNEDGADGDVPRVADEDTYVRAEEYATAINEPTEAEIRAREAEERAREAEERAKEAERRIAEANAEVERIEREKREAALQAEIERRARERALQIEEQFRLQQEREAAARRVSFVAPEDTDIPVNDGNVYPVVEDEGDGFAEQSGTEAPADEGYHYTADYEDEDTDGNDGDEYSFINRTDEPDTTDEDSEAPQGAGGVSFATAEDESEDDENMFTYAEREDDDDGYSYGEDEEDDEDDVPFDNPTVKVGTGMANPNPPPAPPKSEKPDYSGFKFPPLDFLGKDDSLEEDANEEVNEYGEKLIDALAQFDVRASIKGVDRGPRITRYEIVPARGVRVNKVISLFDDIALNLAAEGIRMEAPIPGKSAIGVEIPNKHPSTVYLRDLLESEQFTAERSKTYACVGKDVTGNPVFCDIEKMPHMLIAGATGMGKSVCINSILISILYKARPDEVKFIMIDPKTVEFTMYNGIPHLLVPVVTDVKQAAGALMWAVDEMNRRYEILAKHEVRKLESYNNLVKENPELGDPLPRIIIVIDELNDLMQQAKKTVEGLITSITQKARAAGIHMIIGTQRPSVDVVTGVIKANIPSRIACKVAAFADSKTILDAAGAEKLLDKGDMLFAPVGKPKPIRVQGAFVADGEVDKIMKFLKSTVKGDVYDNEVFAEMARAAQKCSKNGKDADVDDDDEGGDGDNGGWLNDKQFLEAVELAIKSGKISTSLIQRKISVGYGRAAKFIDIMEGLGIVSERNGQKPREVLLSRDEWHEMLNRRMLD